MAETADAPHPAKFTPKILEIIEDILTDLRFSGFVLDPFAGVGGIHSLASPDVHTRAVELEREWAEQSARLGPTWCGDFFQFDVHTLYGSMMLDQKRGYQWPPGYDAVITSPTYANRMADNHNAKERCKACRGTGMISGERADETGFDPGVCPKCEGVGKRNYKRMTYTHQLGRPLSENNSGGMRWGNEYRYFHMRAWKRVCRDVLHPQGRRLFIVNVKNHIRDWEEVDVAGWHCEHIAKLGMDLVEDYKVPVKGMGFGENREARVGSEHVMVFRGGV